MSGESIQGTHTLDLLSTVDEVLTIGSQTTVSQFRIYDTNSPSSGHIVSTRSANLCFTKSSGNADTSVCIGTFTKQSGYMLNVAGSIWAQNDINANVNFRVNNTIVIDASRNLTNIGTVSCGVITGIGSGITQLNMGNATTGTLAVARGGTGIATLTANKIMVGNGTSAVLTPTALHWDGTRLGVNNVSPGYTLDVTGDINTTGAHRVGGTTVIDSSRNLTNIGTVGCGTISTPSRIVMTDVDPGDFISKRYSSTDRYGIGQYNGGIMRIFATVNTPTTWSVRISSPTNDVTNGTAATFTDHVTVLTNSGNVGIGTIPTASSFYKLDVNGSLRLNSQNTVPTNKVLVLYDGNAGETLSGATNFLGFGINANALRYQVTSTNDSHKFYAGATLCATIGSGGVGILTDPVASIALAVNGDINTTSTYKVGGTTVIDSSRNLTNIGTVGCGTITSSASPSGNHTGLVVNNANINYDSGAQLTLQTGPNYSVRIYEYCTSNVANTPANQLKIDMTRGNTTTVDNAYTCTSLSTGDISHVFNGSLQTLSSNVDFPPAALTSDSTIIGSSTYGNGTYVASSSPGQTAAAYQAFDNNINTFWHSQFSSGVGPYFGGNATTGNPYVNNATYNVYTTVGGTAIYGEWIQIQLPYAILLTFYSIYSRPGFSSQAPRDFTLAGSVNGTTWTNLNSQTGITSYTDNVANVYSVTTSSMYNYFRLITTRITLSTFNNVAIGQLVLTGKYNFMIISNSGTIGVNNPSPIYKLDVTGDINTTSTYKVGGTTVIDSSRNLTNIGTVGCGTISTPSRIIITGSDPGDFISKSYGSTDRYGIGQYPVGITRIFATNISGYSVRISSPTNTGTDNTATFTDHVTVLTNSGNVGIGTVPTASSFYKLDVNGSLRLNAQNTVPVNKLLVLYDGNAGETLSGATNFLGFGINANALRYQVTSTNDSHKFYAGVNLCATIGNGGVGILTDPVASIALAVNGDINTSSTYKVGGTTVIDSSRNLTNIGTVGCGAITSTGNMSVTGTVGCGTITTPSRIVITNPDPGDFISKRYGSSDRYGIGQYNNGAMRIFATSGYSVRISTPTDDVTNSTATFTDHVTVLTNSGNVGIGTVPTASSLYKLDVNGSLRINNTTVVGTISNTSPNLEFPPQTFNASSSTTVISGSNYGNGTYVITESPLTGSQGTATDGQAAWKAFDTNRVWPNVWHSGNDANGPYRASDLSYYNSGNWTASTSISGGSSIPGEWMQIQLPNAILLTSYTLFCRTALAAQAPRDFTLAGSVEGSTWYNLDSKTGITSYTDNVGNVYSVTTSSMYKYFRLIVTKNNGNSYRNVAVGQLVLTGKCTAEYGVDVNGSVRFNSVNSTNNKLVVLWDTVPYDNLDSATNFFGFGINTSTLRYQVDSIGSSHKFYAGSTLCGTISSIGFTGPSDARLKTNVRALESALNVVAALKPVRYQWKSGGRNNIGFIAQDVEEVIPEIVEPPATDTDYYGIRTTDIIPFLVKAIQEQQQQINDLKQQIANITKSI